MIVREILPEEKKDFNQVVRHPLQSWQWGQFREKTGREIIRLGVFDPVKKHQLISAYTLSVHPLPVIGGTSLYFPRGPMPDKTMIEALKKIAQKRKAVFVKLEPNVHQSYQKQQTSRFVQVKKFLNENGCQEGRPQFTKYNFILDISQPEEEILKQMKSKTRYNIRLSQRHKVEVVEDNSIQALKIFWQLMEETTKRQRFYARTFDYYQKMREVLLPDKIFHLLLAKYQNTILGAYIFFTFNNILYYPYGASSREHRNKMALYNLMWEAIKLGKKGKATKFDMWGSPGPDPSPKDPWFGFHRFKEGFGATLEKYLGTFDLVIDQPKYKIFTLANSWRWKYLRLRKALPF